MASLQFIGRYLEQKPWLYTQTIDTHNSNFVLNKLKKLEYGILPHAFSSHHSNEYLPQQITRWAVVPENQ
jgi:hypothetical protein